MQTADNQITNAIILNTLDNRKVNLEHIVLEEDSSDTVTKNSKEGF